MKRQLDHLILKKGRPIPFGATPKGAGVNFSLFSRHASRVTLFLFFEKATSHFAKIPLNPELHKTGWVWHIHVENLPEEHIEYAYEISGPSKNSKFNRFTPHTLLSDPYSKGLSTHNRWGEKNEIPPRSRLILDPPFDWQGDSPPNLPLQELLIYEMHVRGFTQHPSSGVKSRGSFLGVLEKIPHLKSLGVNAIELLPLFEFNERELKTVNPLTREPLVNFWGYSTINFFSPMNRFASCEGWLTAIDEFRTLVRELHKHRIEVYLDVVYNHTAEGNETGNTYSFRGIDNQTYYILHPDGSYRNDSGTGNTFNANHPVVTELILDSLRYWVSEMHVDGFRFDLASCLTRDQQGVPLSSPPLIHLITQDPVLANTKLIAEAWDAGGLYQVGSFPGEGRWLEWNGKYRDITRRFIKGTEGESGNFASAMSGSEALYGKWKTPSISVNFVTAHDGYSLRDLVSYQEKHNEENGEKNLDGANDNQSWNCGAEGETDDLEILKLRERQLRNFHCALMLGIGTPMILMGDEYGHSRKGNNNPYCQDNERNWFLWNHLEREQEFYRFFKLMIHFRKTHSIFHRKDFLSPSDVQWHGREPFQPNWSQENRLVAYTLSDPIDNQSLYIAFNASFESVHLHLPPPLSHHRWYRVVDTSLSSPEDFSEIPNKHPLIKSVYELPGHSTFIAKSQ